MTRSSRHKSKRSAKDAREYSDTEEDDYKSKHREKKEGGSRGCKESGEEYLGSKKRKERSDRSGSDRWNGSGELHGVENVSKEDSVQFDEKVSKSKGLIELKSKGCSGRRDVEKKEESVGLVIGKEESRSGKAESKRRSEKDSSEKEKVDRDSSRKDDYTGGREKERVSERDGKILDSKRDSYNQDVDSSERNVMKGVKSKDRVLEDDYQKHESEKERERRRRKKADEFDDKDKYQERYKDSCDSNLKSRRERDKDGRVRDERDKDISGRDKHHEYPDKDIKGRDGEKRGGTVKDRTQKNGEYRDDLASKDHISSPNALDGRHKKSKTDSIYDSSAVYNDQSSRYKDYKESRKYLDKEDYDDIRPQGAKEHLESDKKSAAAREVTVADREMSHSFHTEEPFSGQSRKRRSPSSSAHLTGDQHRYAKQSETKYREPLPEERSHKNLNYGEEGNGSAVYDRAHSSRSIDKSNQIGVSRHHGRTSDRSHDYEDTRDRSNGHKDSNHLVYDGRRSQDMQIDASSKHDDSLVDGNNFHGSSSFSISARMPDNSRSRLPPPSPLKNDNSYAVGSSEEYSKGKLINRPRRHVESNMGRMRGNGWRGVPNWPSPMGNGFLPFPHGPPTAGFHPTMQQFPPQMFGVRPSLDHNGVPYHCGPFGWPNPLDETFQSPMQNWDAITMVPGLDWDQNKSSMISGSRESNVDRYTGSNSGTMESPSGSQHGIAEPVEDFSSQLNHDLKSELCQSNNQADSAGNDNMLGSKFSSDMAASFKDVSDAKVSGKKKHVDSDVHRSCVYLSKIDISAHLAHPKLFDQCVTLLGTKQNASADKRMSKFSLKEESVADCGNTTIYTYISRVPIFAELGDSLLEKAISLYKQQRDDVVATSLSIQSNGIQAFLHPEVQASDTNPSIDGTGSQASLQFCNTVDTEPACHQPLNELPPPNNFDDKADEAATPIICPTSNDNQNEDTENHTKAHINHIPTSDKIIDRVESGNTAGQEIMVEIRKGSKETTNDPTPAQTANVLVEGCEDSMSTGLEIILKKAFSTKVKSSVKVYKEYTQPYSIIFILLGTAFEKKISVHFFEGLATQERIIETAKLMWKLLSLRLLPWSSGEDGGEKVEISRVELAALRSELSELEEREAHLKAQLENIDEILRSARLSGYLYIRTRWKALPGEPPPLDDSDVDDWLPRFVVLHGPCIFFYLSCSELSPLDSSLLSDIDGIHPLPNIQKNGEDTKYAFYISTHHGLRYECSSVSKVQVDGWLTALQEDLKSQQQDTKASSHS